MINIQKNQKEPHLLCQHKSNPDATYDNGPKEMKREILESLIAEQYGLCCYCQQRITIDSASIEHKLSQKKHPDMALDYGNMAGVCSCTEGRPHIRQYCDDFKGEKDFTFDLSDIERLIEYEPQGIIKSMDPVLDDQLNNVLNLNQHTLPEPQRYLVAMRRAQYQAFVDFMRKNPTRGDLNNNIRKFESVKDGKKIAFCGVMLYFLRKRYNRMK